MSVFHVNRCLECGVPEPLGQAQLWLNNGDIVQRIFQANRLAFMATEGLDPLFENIGAIIGTPIESMLINISARANKQYLYRIIPMEIREKIRSGQLEVIPFIDYITTLAQAFGLARYELLGYSYRGDRDDFSRHLVSDPFSLPLTVGAYAGAVSSLVGGDVGVYYEESSPGQYEFTSYWTEYPEIMREKLRLSSYAHQDGDIDWERCGTCGSPLALSSFEWHPEDGRILYKRTGRRMVLLGQAQLDPIFSALEGELGEELPRVVVEAQRMVSRQGAPSIDFLAGRDALRAELALMGLGNLKEMEVDGRGGRMRLDNACMHLIVAGAVQGGFETTFGVESSLEWELSPEGDLFLEILPRQPS